MIETIQSFFKSIFKNPLDTHPDGACKDCGMYDPYYDEDEHTRGFPCVIGKTYYTHLRRYSRRNSEAVEISNHGGATLAFRVFKDDEHYSIEYTWAECNLKEKDQFCKKTGRQLCDDRLNDKDVKLPMLELSDFHPTVSETRDFVIDEFMRYKQRYYSNVWKEYE